MKDSTKKTVWYSIVGFFACIGAFVGIPGLVKEMGKPDKPSGTFSSTKDSRRVVGKWFSAQLFDGMTLEIVEEDGCLLANMDTKYGKKTTSLARESESRGTVFRKVGGSTSGEYFLLRQDGNLEVIDDDGSVGICVPMP